MFIHDIIKMEYVRQGYLPNYPYHLISDTEMFEAFIIHEVKIAKQDAETVFQGIASLWDVPQQFVSLYQLSGYEHILGDDPSLTLFGRKSVICRFLTLVGLSGEVVLSANCFFSSNYPLLFDSISDDYDKLVDDINYHVDTFIDCINSEDDYSIPNWVYSYMTKNVVSVNSTELDIHDFLVLLNLDNVDDEFTEQVCTSCLAISKEWISKLPPSKSIHRPPTMFGEPLVIKSLRIQDSVSS